MGSKVDRQPEGEIARQPGGEVARHTTFSQLTQPIPKPICDRSGQPDITQDVFVVKGETSRSKEIDETYFHEELCSSDRSGQPDITPSVIEARNLSENTRVEQTHDGSGQPDEHKIERQDAPEVHREITTLNTDNELIRERIEEDMDFNILCNVSARSRHFVNVDVVFLPSVCNSFCVSAFSLGQGSRSFCHELYEQSTVMFCESGRDACFEIVCILCADHVFWYPWFLCREFNSCVFHLFGLHANIVGSMCC